MRETWVADATAFAPSLRTRFVLGRAADAAEAGAIARENATHVTPWPCAFGKRRTHCPVRTRHTLIVPPCDADTSSSESREKSTARTACAEEAARARSERGGGSGNAAAATHLVMHHILVGLLVR